MSTLAYTPGRLGVSVTNQPQASVPDIGSLDFKSTFPSHEKSLGATLENDHNEQDHHCEHGRRSSLSEHRACHNSRLKGLFLPAIICLLVLGSLLLASNCVSWYGWSNWGVDNMVRRAVTDDTSSNGSTSFVHNKLYLIVLFVGLFVVVILGIMLSAWCCKGSFKNPLCCPCYLCACCGGLACLECIGCGLCAEIVD